MSELRRGVLRICSNYIRLGLMIILGLLTVPILLAGVGPVGFGLWGLLGATVGLGDLFKEIVQEAKSAGLAGRYHVYASLAPYTGNDIEFYKIPDKVLEHIGFNAREDAFNNDGGTDAD